MPFMQLDLAHSTHAPPRRTVWSVLKHVFRERQIYVRSDAGLRFVVMRPWHLVLATVFGLLAFGWTTVSTISLLDRIREASLAQSRTESIHLSYERRIADMQSATDRLNEKLMLDQGTYVGKVEALRGELVKLLDRQARLEVFFNQGWIPARALETKAPNDDDPDSNAALETPGGGKNAVRYVLAPEDEFKTAQEAEAPLLDIRSRLDVFRSRQFALLDGIQAQGEERSADLRKHFEKLGLDPNKVIAGVRLPTKATGGPLLPVQRGETPQDTLDRKLLEVHRKLVESKKLLHAISVMPIKLPFAKGYRLTSGFGYRRDPFKDVLAMHTGIDLMTAYGAPIKAPAAGVVTRADTSDVYGRVIDIRHDNGITTRYAHLSVMDVESGDKVEVDQVIGRVGTSGRSTGPHLHYETRVNGKPIDPYQFLRIARNVFQKTKSE